jgi:rubrerythrin
MNIETIKNKSDEFKSLFEEKIKPLIIEKINNSEDKVALSETYISEVLKTYYVTNTLNLKIKNAILGTNLGVSVNNRTKEFIFYKVSEDVKRESDLFEKNFNDKIKPFLLRIFKTKYIIGFEENFLKKYLNINYNTNNIYQRLRNILLNENISVSINKNVMIEGKKTNEFIFCDIIKKRKIDEENNENMNKNKEVDKDKEDFDNYILKSEKEEREKNKKIHDEMIKEGVKSIKKLLEQPNNKEINESDNNTILCPNCKKGKIEYPETICPICNVQILKKWE